MIWVKADGFSSRKVHAPAGGWIWGGDDKQVVDLGENFAFCRNFVDLKCRRHSLPAGRS
jgi:hypothetical protein